uniref:SFRICE_027718 n=1 Tax=Spodoptera frugiperda TaxID=7108 RepID=A0A2H1VM58_SPOFR
MNRPRHYLGPYSAITIVSEWSITEQKRVQFNGCVVSLRCSLPGPQVVELELTRSIVGSTRLVSSTVVRLFVIISQY